MRPLIPFTTVLFITLLTGCDLFKPPYQVDAALEPYVEKFVAEAAARGRTIDVHASGLIVEFADLKEGTAGICYYLNPRKIQIDKEYWDKLAGFQNAEEMREDVIFHELAHGLLNRDHDNSYLPNGDWKTMMCGGSVRDNRSWNINYRSIRREYYLDELFNESTPVPSWATDNPDFSASLEPGYVDEDFTISSASWVTGSTSQYNAQIADGLYSFSTKTSTGSYLYVNTNLPIQNDFYYEIRMKIVSMDADNKCGIAFGSSDQKESNYFIINNNGRMFMGNSNCYGWYTELIKSAIIPNEYNMLGFRKRGLYVYYYINNELVYIDKMETVVDGKQFGFNIAGNSTLYVDYFKLNAPESSFRSAIARTPISCVVANQETRPTVLR